MSKYIIEIGYDCLEEGVYSINCPECLAEGAETDVHLDSLIDELESIKCGACEREYEVIKEVGFNAIKVD
jgi:hypothetical protein